MGHEVTDGSGGTGGGLDGVGSLPSGATVHVYDHVYRLVRHAMLSRQLAPGTRVVEAALADQLQVSRTPVRDALRRLEGDGLLERVGSSLTVATFDAGETEDVFLVRLVLDRLAAELAAGRNQAADWEPLRDQARSLGPVVEQWGTGSYQFSEAHDELHGAIYRMAFAPKVAGMLNSRLMGLVEIAGGLSYRDGSREPVVAQHLELIEAMAGGDPARARAAVDDHVRTARESAAQLH